MRINSSKSIAALMAVCVGTLSSVTAMAASMVTNTTYTYDAGSNARVYVESAVSGVENGKQVTYLVSKANPTTGSDIVFIDQKKAETTSVTFAFEANQTDLYKNDYSIQAKVGTDSTIVDNQTSDIHKFTEGVNYYQGNGAPSFATEGQGSDEDMQNAKKLFGEAIDSSKEFKVVFAKLNGNASGYEYGFKDANGNKYRAMGCGVDGLFCVVLNFDGAADLTLTPYKELLSTTSGN